MQYKLSNRSAGVIKDDGAGIISWVPEAEGNADWQVYQRWLAEDPENNIPEPADD